MGQPRVFRTGQNNAVSGGFVSPEHREPLIGARADRRSPAWGQFVAGIVFGIAVCLLFGMVPW